MASPRSLTLQDFADRDLLNALDETGDEDGWATAEEVAATIGIDHEHPTHCVGTRFGWLRRYGVLETQMDGGIVLWRINEKGRALLHPGELSAAAQRALAQLDEGQRVMLTDKISRELPRSSREGAHMARRAWIHNFGSWRDRTIAPKRKAT